MIKTFRFPVCKTDPSVIFLYFLGFLLNLKDNLDPSIPRQISISSICRLASIYLATFLRPFNKQLFAMNKLAGLCDPRRLLRSTDVDQFKRSNNI